MALLATSCTMRNKPSRLLDKGPEYLRTRTNTQLFERRRKSAVELLAASKLQYVKSPAVRETTSTHDLAVAIDRLPARSPRRRFGGDKGPPRSKSEYDISRIPLDDFDDVDGSPGNRRGSVEADEQADDTESKGLILSRELKSLISLKEDKDLITAGEADAVVTEKEIETTHISKESEAVITPSTKETLQDSSDESSHVEKNKSSATRVSVADEIVSSSAALVTASPVTPASVFTRESKTRSKEDATFTSASVFSTPAIKGLREVSASEAAAAVTSTDTSTKERKRRWRGSAAIYCADTNVSPTGAVSKTETSESESDECKQSWKSEFSILERNRRRKLSFTDGCTTTTAVTTTSAITRSDSSSSVERRNQAGVTSTGVITRLAADTPSTRPLQINSASDRHVGEFLPVTSPTTSTGVLAVSVVNSPPSPVITSPASSQPPPLPPKPAHLTARVQPKPPAKPPVPVKPKFLSGVSSYKPLTPAVSTAKPAVFTAKSPPTAVSTTSASSPVVPTIRQAPPIPTARSSSSGAIYTAKPIYINLTTTVQAGHIPRDSGAAAAHSSGYNPVSSTYNHSITTITASQAAGLNMSEESSDKTPTNPHGGEVTHVTALCHDTHISPSSTDGMTGVTTPVTTPVEDGAACAANRDRDRSSSRTGDLTDSNSANAAFGSISGVHSGGTSSPRPPLQIPVSELSSGISGYPVPRSFSDISCHHSRAGSDVSSEASRASRTSRASRASAGANLEKFFNEMGMEKDILDPMLRRQQRHYDGSERDIYESVSSLDSHDARSICSALSRSEREISGTSDAESIDRSQQQTSIVERNARIIKWLCSVKKAKQGPAGFQGSAS